MYAGLWALLPGPVWLRVLLLIILVAAILVVCVIWVFPWVQAFTVPQEVTVGP